MHVDDYVDSPCISVCTIAVDGFCMGCKRSINEIAMWPHMSNDEKRGVIAALPARHEKKPPLPSPVPPLPNSKG